MIQESKKINKFTHSEIESVSKRLFVASEWIEKFGKPIYYLQHVETIKKLLLKNGLSDEWDIIQFGEKRRWFIFLSKDKTNSMNRNSSRIKIPPLLIEKIRSTDFSEYGAQRRLAAQLEIDEGYLSKIRRELRRTKNVPGKKLTKNSKNKLFIERGLVEEFLNTVLTAQDFIIKFGSEYNIKHLSDVYRMCAKKKNFSLPKNWYSVKNGETWLLYYYDDSLS